MRYKVTFTFRKAGWSPSESYISAELEQVSFLSILQSLITARNRILPKAAEWVSVRIGQHILRRRSRAHKPGVRFPFANIDNSIAVPPEGEFDDTEAVNSADQTRACLLMDRTFDVDRHSTAYMSMVLDAVVREEPIGYDPNGNPNWNTRLISYCNTIKDGGWSVYARKQSAGFLPVPILKWTTQEAGPSLLGAEIPAASAANFIRNAEVQVSNVKRRGGDGVSYNGTYVISAVNATLIPGSVIVYLKNTDTGDPDSIRRPGTIQVRAWDYFPIVRTLPIIGGTRQRGNSAEAHRGRSRRRDTLAR